jgi:hypothetical protein
VISNSSANLAAFPAIQMLSMENEIALTTLITYVDNLLLTRTGVEESDTVHNSSQSHNIPSGTSF